jgi:hypothetical protein
MFDDGIENTIDTTAHQRLLPIFHAGRSRVNSDGARFSLVFWLRHGQQQHLIDRTRAHTLSRSCHTTATV